MIVKLPVVGHPVGFSQRDKPGCYLIRDRAAFRMNTPAEIDKNIFITGFRPVTHRTPDEIGLNMMEDFSQIFIREYFGGISETVIPRETVHQKWRCHISAEEVNPGEVTTDIFRYHLLFRQDLRLNKTEIIIRVSINILKELAYLIRIDTEILLSNILKDLTHTDGIPITHTEISKEP
jgi:hypothetical protein